jgi:hypothetical protein
LLPTHKDRPLSIPDFDKQETMEILRRMVTFHTPGLIIIDSTTYASIYNTGKPNEAKMAYDPVMNVLTETSAAALGLAHTNREGVVLNRRLLERCRSEITISKPDPDHPEQLRIEITKTDDKSPPAIGAVHTDTGITYTSTPPQAPATAPRGRPARTSPGLADFLLEFLQPGPSPVVDIVRAARDKGLLKQPSDKEPTVSISPLYDAKKWVERLHPNKQIREFLVETENGKKLKHWEIIDKPSASVPRISET